MIRLNYFRIINNFAAHNTLWSIVTYTQQIFCIQNCMQNLEMQNLTLGEIFSLPGAVKQEPSLSHSVWTSTPCNVVGNFYLSFSVV